MKTKLTITKEELKKRFNLIIRKSGQLTNHTNGRNQLDIAKEQIINNYKLLLGGYSMQERRRYKRLPIHLELEINQLYKQDNVIISDLEEEIEVINISKTGIGFLSQADLPLEFYFNAKIEFNDKQFFYCVLKIIRKENLEQGIIYGCEFVGLAEFLSKKVDDYEAFLED